MFSSLFGRKRKLEEDATEAIKKQKIQDDKEIRLAEIQKEQLQIQKELAEIQLTGAEIQANKEIRLAEIQKEQLQIQKELAELQANKEIKLAEEKSKATTDLSTSYATAYARLKVKTNTPFFFDVSETDKELGKQLLAQINAFDLCNYKEEKKMTNEGKFQKFILDAELKKFETTGLNGRTILNTSGQSFIADKKPDYSVYSSSTQSLVTLVCLGEVKFKDKILDNSDKGQIAIASQLLLKNLPYRKFIFSFLISNKQILFFKCYTNNDGDFEYYETAASNIDDDGYSLGQLFSLLRQEDDDLGYKPFLFKNHQITDYLSFGASSVVFKNPEDPNSIIKKYNFREDMDTEIKCYAKLGNNPYFLEKGEVDEESWMVTFSPICKQISRMTSNYCIQLIDATKALHESGYVHRDIRPENILVDQKDNIKLVDLAFATPIDQSSGGYLGCFRTASNRILENIKNGTESEIGVVTIQDDLESIIHTIYYIFTKQSLPRDASCILHARETFYKGAWSKPFKLLSSSSSSNIYEELKKSLLDLI